jgi:hypothetical protein
MRLAFCLLLLQDRGWLEELKEAARRGDALKAASIRESCADVKEARVIRNLLLLVSLSDSKEAAALLADLAQYLEAPTAETALALKSAASFWLALRHSEIDPSTLGLVSVSEGRWATPDGAILEQIQKSQSDDEIEKLSRKGSVEVKYAAALALLKRSHFEKASRILSAIRKTEHIEVLLEALKPFKACTGCRGSKKVTCAMCGGDGESEVICPQCDGAGKVKLKQVGGSDGIKNRNGNQPVNVRVPGGEIVSVRPGETVCPTCVYTARQRKIPCTICAGTKIVQCQKCRWVKGSIEDIGKLEPCSNCDSTGFASAKVLHPCLFCKGAGAFLIPAAAPHVKAGPTR